MTTLLTRLPFRDFLFGKDRTIWVFTDRQATKVGAIFERDMQHGEALTAFNAKGGDVEHVEDDDAVPSDKV